MDLTDPSIKPKFTTAVCRLLNWYQWAVSGRPQAVGMQPAPNQVRRMSRPVVPKSLVPLPVYPAKVSPKAIVFELPSVQSVILYWELAVNGPWYAIQKGASPESS